MDESLAGETETGRRIGLAVIGLGMAAKPHLEALKQLGDSVELRGIWSRTAARAEKAAAEHGFPRYRDLDSLLADEALDGVILLTPPDQRRELIARLAKAGKHILMEKPIERTTEAAVEIVTLCKQAGITAGMVFQHRFRAASLRLRALMREGHLGEIAMVRLTVPWWRPQSYYDEPGRGTYARDGGGVLITQAIHAIDMMLSVAGPVETVQALCATTKLHKLEAEDFAAGGLRFASGAVGSITATTAAWPGGGERLEIDGTDTCAALEAGHLTVRWRDGRIEELGEAAAGGGGGGADPMAFPCDWHRDLIADFASAIRERRAPLATPQEALHVHALIDAMTESSRSGRAVTVVAPPGAAEWCGSD